MINNVDITIWGRDYSLPVKYDCYPGEVITEQQISMVSKFIKHPEWIDNAKVMIEKYCKADLIEDDNNKKKDNIFSYIHPHYLYVNRRNQGDAIYLICDYRYDEEHGLAIGFSKDGSIVLGSEDRVE